FKKKKASPQPARLLPGCRKGEGSTVPALPVQVPVAALLGRYHGHRALIQGATGVELDVAIDQGVERVILADTDIAARMELGTTLTHDDGTCGDQLTAEDLDAQAFSL